MKENWDDNTKVNKSVIKYIVQGQLYFLHQFIAHAAGQNTVNELFTHLYPDINIDEMAKK